MKLRIKELCKQKGMRMADIAEKVGVDYSNLTSSLNGNPTLKRLNDVATALGVHVSELFDRPAEAVALNGYVEIEGEILPVRTCDDWARAANKISGFPSVPVYSSLSDLRSDIKKYVHDNVAALRKQSSLWGMLGSREIFCLSSVSECIEQDGDHVDDKIFVLSLLKSGETFTYDLIEYGNAGQYDLDGDQGLVVMIRMDIEKCMESMESAEEE